MSSWLLRTRAEPRSPPPPARAQQGWLQGLRLSHGTRGPMGLEVGRLPAPRPASSALVKKRRRPRGGAERRLIPSGSQGRSAAHLGLASGQPRPHPRQGKAPWLRPAPPELRGHHAWTQALPAAPGKDTVSERKGKAFRKLKGKGIGRSAPGKPGGTDRDLRVVPALCEGHVYANGRAASEPDLPCVPFSSFPLSLPSCFLPSRLST